MVGLLRASRHQQLEERLRAANLWQDSRHVFTTELGHPVHPATCCVRHSTVATTVAASVQSLH